MSVDQNYAERRNGGDNTAPPLPRNLEAERAILGAILLDPAAPNASLANASAAGLRPSHFSDAHRLIFAQMIALNDSGTPINTVTLKEELERHGKLDAAGGPGYIAELPDGRPHLSHIESFVEIVREHAYLRSAIYAAEAVEDRAFDGDIEGTRRAIEDLASIAKNGRPKINWRERFHSVDELPEGGQTALINHFLPEGVAMIGSLSGVGKTFLGISMSKALTTASPFLGIFRVPTPVPVIYLVPEMGAAAFRARCEKFVITDNFYCQTMRDGVCSISDPALLAAVEELRPVVFLDTMVGFSRAESENDAAQSSQGLAAGVFKIMAAGARGVVGMHHAPKSSGDADFMTLENVLRGTGDFGAMADCVWGVTHDKTVRGQTYLEESQDLTRLFLKCVKPRDLPEPAQPFRIQGRPHIDESGDFVVLHQDQVDVEGDLVAAAIEKNPQISKLQVEKLTGCGRNRVELVAQSRGWTWESGTGWFRK